MSEEVQDTQASEETVETTEAPPAAEATETAETTEAPAKKKKINRLSAAELNKKIEEMESKNMTQSRYYKHLMMRKKELETV